MLDIIKSLFKNDEIQRSEEENARISAECESLKLYHIHSCPYCIRVRKAIKKLGLNIEQRDINVNTDWEKELISHGGKRQVPCLRITDENDGQTWMYESIDIINYLTDKFRN